MGDWKRLLFCLPGVRPRTNEDTPSMPQPPSTPGVNIPLQVLARPPQAYLGEGETIRASMPPRVAAPKLEESRPSTSTKTDASTSGVKNTQLNISSAGTHAGPIVAQSGPEFLSTIDDFTQSIAELKPLPGQDAKWQSRLEDTHAMAECVRKEVTRRGADGLVFSFEDAPVGLMSILPNNDDQCLEVAAFVTHPLSEGAGMALLEAAVNHSESLGMQGRLEGDAINDQVKQIYLSIGGVDEAYRMTLDPSTSGKWEQANGQWRLKKYAGAAVHGDVASMNRVASEKVNANKDQ